MPKLPDEMQQAAPTGLPGFSYCSSIYGLQSYEKLSTGTKLQTILISNFLLSIFFIEVRKATNLHKDIIVKVQHKHPNV